ncbi:hypothetical protein CH304_16235 [Rhodococcus sp. 15-649-1-2]|nr:hypothetical protein [Rhodococcus sp. 15-649-1-2]OZE80779.1 hypothetical protein CH304_16235 [Rhodococcus sp. 15-649-1-2]
MGDGLVDRRLQLDGGFRLDGDNNIGDDVVKSLHRSLQRGEVRSLLRRHPSPEVRDQINNFVLRLQHLGNVITPQWIPMAGGTGRADRGRT